MGRVLNKLKNLFSIGRESFLLFSSFPFSRPLLFILTSLLPLLYRLHHLKDHLTIPEMISLHQAYYIKKTEYRVKWLLEYRLNQLLQSLASAPSPHQDQHHDHDVNQKEIQLNIQQLRDELLRIHPTNQTRENLNHLRSSLPHNLLVSDNAAMGIGLRTERPLVRVCDLIQTEIVGVEVWSQKPSPFPPHPSLLCHREGVSTTTMSSM
jgi:hypothetical protein